MACGATGPENVTSFHNFAINSTFADCHAYAESLMWNMASCEEQTVQVRNRCSAEPWRHACTTR